MSVANWKLSLSVLLFGINGLRIESSHFARGVQYAEGMLNIGRYGGSLVCLWTLGRPYNRAGCDPTARISLYTSGVILSSFLSTNNFRLKRSSSAINGFFFWLPFGLYFLNLDPSDSIFSFSGRNLRVYLYAHRYPYRIWQYIARTAYQVFLEYACMTYEQRKV